MTDVASWDHSAVRAALLARGFVEFERWLRAQVAGGESLAEVLAPVCSEFASVDDFIAILGGLYHDWQEMPREAGEAARWVRPIGVAFLLGVWLGQLTLAKIEA